MLSLQFSCTNTESLPLQCKITIVFTHGSIAAVGQRTRLAVTKSSDIKLVAAEASCPGPNSFNPTHTVLDFVGAELVVNNLPNHVVLVHQTGVTAKKKFLHGQCSSLTVMPPRAKTTKRGE